MGPLYKAYITKHPTANTQFQSLPPSPALTQYNAQCRKLVAAHSNAWDVPSFLIKPVQRLLKYPLLLGTIYNETPDSHPDKQNLIDAKVKIEEVARMVNEGRRRWEVVKTVLNGNSKANSAANGAGAIATRSGAPKMTRMRSFRTKIKPNGETIDVERDRIELEQWEKRIKESESVVKDVAKRTFEFIRVFAIQTFNGFSVRNQKPSSGINLSKRYSSDSRTGMLGSVVSPVLEKRASKP